MRFVNRQALVAAIVIGSMSWLGCADQSAPTGGADDGTVKVEMQLQIAPGVTVNTVAWSIANAATGFSRSGTVNVQFSNTVKFQVGAIPSANGYTISLSATSTDGVFTCVGSSTFNVTAGMITNVGINLACSGAATDAGTIVVTGTTEICANVDSISVSPLETTVNNPIALAATASAGSVTPTFAWTATAGTFDNAASATPVFTCPATPGTVTLTVTVGPNGAGCTTATTKSVDVTCDTLNPTFTNVYANIIGVRCIGCHRPGGSGVTTGMLDMSTLAAAYTNLVGVPAAGVGAGASGVTCASLAPGLLRVAPNDAADSLLFEKVNSKLQMTPAPCGSPMPLPAAGAPLTAAQVNLIQAWINAGALNN